MDNPIGDKRILIEIVQKEMPFGKYAGRKLCDLPTSYLAWFYAQGWPKGRLGAEINIVRHLLLLLLNELFRLL